MSLIKKPKKYSRSLTNNKGDYLPEGMQERDLYNVKKMIMHVMMRPTKLEISGLEHMFWNIREKALEGDKFYVKIILEYLYGKPLENSHIIQENVNVNVPNIVFLDEEEISPVVIRTPVKPIDIESVDALFEEIKDDLSDLTDETTKDTGSDK